MKILIVGLGSVGRRHLRNLVALGQTDLVLLRSGKSTLPEEELEGFQVVTDLEAALRHRPEAAVIATPTALHLEAAIPLARAGCHLLLEKPVSHTMEGVAELQEAVARGGGHVMVAFQYRHHPGLRTVQRWLKDGAIGRPLTASAHYGDYLPGWHPWEDYRQAYSARSDLGGGVVLTLCHPLDYLLWLLGDVVQVTAATSARGGIRYRRGGQRAGRIDLRQRRAGRRSPQLRAASAVACPERSSDGWDDPLGPVRWSGEDSIAEPAGTWEVAEAPAGL